MLEKSVDQKRGSYLFCDTDSLCIVGQKKVVSFLVQEGHKKDGGRTNFRPKEVERGWRTFLQTEIRCKHKHRARYSQWGAG